MAKRRLDTLLVDRGLAESPEKAQALVMAGVVSVNERPAPKAGVMVPDDVSLDVKEGRRFVSRGGEKLDHALETFGLDVNGLVAVVGERQPIYRLPPCFDEHETTVQSS